MQEGAARIGGGVSSAPLTLPGFALVQNFQPDMIDLDVMIGNMDADPESIGWYVA